MSVTQEKTEVTATEFQTRAGTYIDQSARKPIFITKHGRAARVLMDIEEYERMKENQVSEAFMMADISEEDAEWMFDGTDDLPEESHQAQLDLEAPRPR